MLDEDHKLIYTHAIARLAKIYGNKEHYIHQKANRHQGKQTKQYEKQLIAKCTKAWTAPYHRWAPHRSGHQCGVCGVRVHQALTVQVIEDRLQEECPQLSIEEHLPEQASPHRPIPKKLTRQQVIKQLLQQQQDEAPAPNKHELEETAGYLRCVKCGSNVHKRSNEQAFQAFVTGQCLDQAYTKPHEGHTSHALWQKGGKVSCTQCGLSLHLDAQHRVILTAAIRKPCKGAVTAGSPPITDYFTKQATGAAQHKAQITSPSKAEERPTVRPTPRRLHFATQLTEGEDTMHPAQAKTPSLSAGPRASQDTNAQSSETTPEATDQQSTTSEAEPEEAFQVDYF